MLGGVRSWQLAEVCLDSGQRMQTQPPLPQAGREAADAAVPECRLTPHLAKNSPWSEPPGRSITRGKPPRQAEPRDAPSRDPKQQGCVRTGRLPCSLEEPMPDVAAW